MPVCWTQVENSIFLQLLFTIGTSNNNEMFLPEEKLICALLRKNKKHFLKEPIGLECGGFVCKECLGDYIRQSRITEELESVTVVIECPAESCNLKHSARNLLMSPSNHELKTLFDENIRTVFCDVVQRFSSEYESKTGIMEWKLITTLLFVSKFLEVTEKVNSVFKYHEEEIDIRLESIKIEVDQMAKVLTESTRNAKIEQQFYYLENEIQLVCGIDKNPQKRIKKCERIIKKVKQCKFYLKMNEKMIERSCFGCVIQKPLIGKKKYVCRYLFIIQVSFRG
jgi:hypothetical protein